MAKTIVVYGATMAGVAAAAKAAKNAPSATIHLIVPDPVDDRTFLILVGTMVNFTQKVLSTGGRVKWGSITAWMPCPTF